MLPVVNENDTVATSEIRFGDNDRLAALVAHLVHADLLLLLCDVDGLYDGNPGQRRGHPARSTSPPTADLDGRAIGGAGSAGLGTGGMVTKVEAARIATGAGIPVVLTSARQAAAALAGDQVGTLFHPTGRRRPTRLLWLAHATEATGPAHARRRRGPGADRAARLAAAGRHHRACTAPSSPVTPSTWWTPTACPWRAAWSTTTPPSYRPCSAARPTTWPRARSLLRARGRAPRRPGAPAPRLSASAPGTAEAWPEPFR